MWNKISDEAKGYVFVGAFLLVATLLGVCCAVDLESRGHGRAFAILFGAACSVMGLSVGAFLLFRIWSVIRREKRTGKSNAVSNKYDSPSQLPEGVSERLELVRVLESGVLDGLTCPRCHRSEVTVRFTHPYLTEYRTWFLCNHCDFRCRVQNSGIPAYFSTERIDDDLEARDGQ